MSARSIRVNALLPGWVDSDMWRSKFFLHPLPASTFIYGRLCRHYSQKALLIYNSLSPLDLKPELQQAYLKDTPLNRVADPAEVADAAVFLAANEFANNCVLNLDGGLSAA